MARVEDTPDNASICICPDCPTYNNCMGMAGELLYCARGKTGCDAEARRCICPDCPVYATYELSTLFFCLKGAAG